MPTSRKRNRVKNVQARTRTNLYNPMLYQLSYTNYIQSVTSLHLYLAWPHLQHKMKNLYDPQPSRKHDEINAASVKWRRYKFCINDIRPNYRIFNCMYFYIARPGSSVGRAFVCYSSDPGSNLGLDTCSHCRFYALLAM